MTSIASMTGFARVDGHWEDVRWTWEVRSVNGKGLDLRVRAPSFVEGADRAVRQAASAQFTRGSLQFSLTVERADVQSVSRIDKAALQVLLNDLATIEIPDGANVEPARLDGLLQIRGIMVTGDAVDEDESYRTAPLADIPKLIAALHIARLEEGARLAALLSAKLAEIAGIAAAASRLAAKQPEALAARYRETIARLAADAGVLSEDRILQEAAALAVKADVSEELDRLAAHVDQARDLLAEGGAVGRRFDFLAQEFNREANTLGAKSADLELTRLSMDLKAAIDSFREQVQNVE
jgi:uncharacterized protein (TIGR00255 family)